MTVWDHSSLAGSPGHEQRRRRTATTTVLRAGVAVGGLCAALLVFGFVLFAANVMRQPPPITQSADGIIVLTGGDYRIGEGARLLREGRAGRMLISGVNAKTSRDDLIKLSGLANQTFDCCVELGYAAQDTLGNAEEARTWVQARGLTRLIIVTSNYHMPRSLAELAIALPEAQLVPASVVPLKFRNGAWWVHGGATRILLSEYVKFLPVALRLSVMRMVRPWSSAAPARGAG